MTEILENEYRVIGPPGCGKSTYVTGQAELRLRAYMQRTGQSAIGCTDVLVTSLTKAAAAEIRGRGLEMNPDQIGTLHSHCYRALGGPKMCVGGDAIKQWNEECGGMQYMLSDGGMSDDPLGGSIGRYGGDEMLAMYGVYRSRCESRKTWRPDVTQFVDRYETWKRINGFMDFHDLIDRCLADDVPPPNHPAVILCDEGQDSTTQELNLIRQWAKHVNKLIVVGDPDQCHPAGEMVRTIGGDSVPIEQLDSSLHRLVSCNYRDGYITGPKSSVEFKVGSRSYTGQFVAVDAGDGHVVRCTHDHKWRVRWSSRSREWNCVYLMRQGSRWRVGWCQVLGGAGFHFGVRCRMEGADAGWILRVFDNKKDASVYEKVVAARYGIPQIVFAPNEAHEYFDEAGISAVFGQLDLDAMRRSALECLRDHDRFFDCPLYELDARLAKRGRRTPFIVRACNLIPEMMDVPAMPEVGRTPDWCRFSVRREWVRDVKVYGLNVTPFHNYCVGGLFVENCIFGWRGAEPDGFYATKIPDGHTKVLEQSYRVPRAVHSAAMKIVELIADRVPVAYHPRDEEGVLESSPHSLRGDPGPVVDEIETILATTDETVMLLFPCAYMASSAAEMLRRRGILYWNPYAPGRGRFNPFHPQHGTSTLDKVRSFLRPSREVFGDDARLWTYRELQDWSSLCNGEGWLLRGARKDIESAAKMFGQDAVSIDFLRRVVVPDFDLSELAHVNLSWLLKHRSAQSAVLMETIGMSADRIGESRTVNADPRVIVGTVHSVKGGEAHHVYVCPDLSASGFDLFNSAEGRDATLRMLYVAVTRARKRLVLTAPGGRMAFDWSEAGL